MAKIKVGAAVLLLVASCVGAALGAIDDAKTSELELSMTPRAVVARQGEHLAVRGCVKNRSDRAVYVFGDLGYGIRFWSLDETGIPIAMDFVREYLPPPPRSRDQFVRIEPGHLLCRDFDESLDSLSIDVPGRYKLQVEFVNPVSPDWVREYLGLSIWAGSPISIDPIEVEVLPKR